MLSTVSAGYYAAAMIKKRAEILGCCIRLIQRINSDISYNAEPLHVIIDNASQCSEFDKLTFLQKILKSESDNITLGWKECVESFCRCSPITKDDAALLVSFGKKLGTSDVEHQQKLCDEYTFLLKQRYDSVRNNLSERIKMCKVCSFAAGAVMLILLI